MANTYRKEVQRGEWWEIGGKLTDPVTGLPRDVTGCLVSATVRRGPKSSDEVVTVDGSGGGVLDGPAGTVWVGGRVASAGDYWATIEVTDATPPTRGWPVREVWRLVVTECP